jgi:SAM-dependent methyltransferase
MAQAPTSSFRKEAEIFVENLRKEVALDRQMDVIDFGCGYGFVAALLAPAVTSVTVCDMSPAMLAHARQTLGPHTNVRFTDAGDAAGLNECRGADLILVNSVLQYMPTVTEARAALTRLSASLKPGGRMIVSDVIPPGYSLSVELLALLIRHPNLVARRLSARTLPYLGKLSTLTLLRISRDDLESLADDNGLDMTLFDRNLTHFPRRTAAMFRRPAIN